MKTAAIISAAGAAGLASTVSAQQYFGLLAIHSASPIMYEPVVAREEGLWLGGKTSSYCPGVVKKQHDCPKGTETNFAGGNGGLAMGALVPGGQQVYIERDTGLVKYTQAHSDDTFGGVTGGWKLEQLAEYGKLTHRGGLYACSTSGKDAGPWQVYVKLSGVELPSKKPAGCLSFWGLAANETKPDAWEYT